MLAGTDHVIVLEAVCRELRDVAREEVTALAVQQVEVSLVHLRGQFVVDGSATEVRFLEDRTDATGDCALAFGGDNGAGRQAQYSPERALVAREDGCQDGEDRSGNPPGRATQGV